MRGGTSVEHFGESIRPGKYGYRLTRDMYAVINKRSSLSLINRDSPVWELVAPNYEDEDHRILTDEWCQQHREDALENFDLNMAFFAQIDREAFEAALREMLSQSNNIGPIYDLRRLDGATGLYVMVLDDYKQAYIGEAEDIRDRIKRHWQGTKQFDRLLWGHKHTSVLSIDSFRALDTTRIYAVRTKRADVLEEKLVASFPPDFLLNRIAGGQMDGARARFIEREVKRRQLVLSTGEAG